MVLGWCSGSNTSLREGVIAIVGVLSSWKRVLESVVRARAREREREGGREGMHGVIRCYRARYVVITD